MNTCSEKEKKEEEKKGICFEIFAIRDWVHLDNLSIIYFIFVFVTIIH